MGLLQQNKHVEKKTGNDEALEAEFKLLMTVSNQKNRLSLMTGFQLILPVPNHNVTKDLMSHRMHVEDPQLYQMNRQINSFQNICDML